MIELVEVDEDEDDEPKDDVEAQARAQCVMACSTSAEIAPSLPPKAKELEDEVEGAIDDKDSGRGVLEGVGGSPR